MDYCELRNIVPFEGARAPLELLLKYTSKVCVEEVVDHVEPPVESEVKHEEPCESNVRVLYEVRNFYL